MRAGAAAARAAPLRGSQLRSFGQLPSVPHKLWDRFTEKLGLQQIRKQRDPSAKALAEKTAAAKEAAWGAHRSTPFLFSCQKLLEQLSRADAEQSAVDEALANLCSRGLGIAAAVPARISATVRDGSGGGEAVKDAVALVASAPEGSRCEIDEAEMAHRLACCAAKCREHAWAVEALRHALMLRMQRHAAAGGDAQGATEDEESAKWRSLLVCQLNHIGKYTDAVEAASPVTADEGVAGRAPSVYVHAAYAELRRGRAAEADRLLDAAQRSPVQLSVMMKNALGSLRSAVTAQLRGRDGSAAAIEDMAEGPVWLVARDVGDEVAAVRDQRWRRGPQAAAQSAATLLAAFAASDECRGKDVRIFFDHGAEVDAVEGAEVTVATAEQGSAEAALEDALLHHLDGGGPPPAIVANSARLRRLAGGAFCTQEDDEYPAPLLDAADLRRSLARVELPPAAGDAKTGSPYLQQGLTPRSATYGS
eukprot:TRINITY_DN50420_c0_g1_i1.p2 TRINITY_DN50420_c0_g1~~TRINITY_DN50420_c0_g1_i1.p2  ORF type:complete len:478 (+),score=140.09 TRINITY_DN50420_c0_g1_i1:67-1500(+)